MACESYEGRIKREKERPTWNKAEGERARTRGGRCRSCIQGPELQKGPVVDVVRCCVEAKGKETEKRHLSHPLPPTDEIYFRVELKQVTMRTVIRRETCGPVISVNQELRFGASVYAFESSRFQLLRFVGGVCC